jgi:hypothetical protein
VTVWQVLEVWQVAVVAVCAALAVVGMAVRDFYAAHDA